MLNEASQDSALVGLHSSYGKPLRHGLEQTALLTEHARVEIVNLRADSASEHVRGALHQTVGLELPTIANTVAQGQGLIALWLAPDEWLLRADCSVRDGLAAKVEQALGNAFFAVTDQTSGYCVMQLRGPKSREVLSAGCSLDLHPRVLRTGQCAQTHYFKASILLRPLGDEGDHWELIVRRSFADYTAHMLLDAMGE